MSDARAIDVVELADGLRRGGLGLVDVRDGSEWSDAPLDRGRL